MEIAMFESSKKHLAWIVKQEMAINNGLSASNLRKCVMAAIIEERLNKMLNQIDNDEEHGFLPIGSLAQARRELGYID